MFRPDFQGETMGECFGGTINLLRYLSGSLLADISRCWYDGSDLCSRCLGKLKEPNFFAGKNTGDFY
jgi:hypothetical protein